MTPMSAIMKESRNMKSAFDVEQCCLENTIGTSGCDFFRRFHELEGFGFRTDRFYDDILPYIDEQKDSYAATRIMIKWLEAAFEAGVNQQKFLTKAQD